MNTIYLSGPMSGIANHNMPAFNAEADRLRAHGYQVINPAEINVDGGDWKDCLRADIRQLMDCDTLALLPGWENSQGAHLELHIAHRVGIAVVMAKEIANVCKWRQIGIESSTWDTDCGLSWRLEDGSPSDNEIAYCHGCGRPMVEVEFEEATEAAA